MNETLPTRRIRPVPSYLPVEGTAAAMPAGDGEGGAELELREYLKVLFKFRFLIGVITLSGVLLALVYSFTTTPLYVSASKVRIGTYEPILTATKIEDMLQQKSKETNYLETQLEEMMSYSLADRVLEDPEIRNGITRSRRKGFLAALFSGREPEAAADPDGRNGSYKASLTEIREYLKLIEVKPVRRTAIVNINATSPSASLAALIANKHAQSYIEWVRTTRIEQQARGLKFLKSQAEELREKVADLERELAEYAEANSIVALNKDENITVQKMSRLNEILTAATAKRIEAENLYKEAETSLKSPSAGFDDPSTQTIRSELAKFEAEYSELGQKFTPQYPKMRQLKSQIDELRRAVEAQRRQIVLGLKAKAAAVAEEEKRLRDELEQQKSQAFELSKRQVQYNVLNRDLTSSRELLQNVLRQIKETSLAVESNASNISIVDLAVVPIAPSYPRKRLFVLFGAAFGVALGAGLAFLLNYLDNTVRTPEQLVTLAQLPSLGVVPSFALEQLDSPSRGDKLAAAEEPQTKGVIPLGGKEAPPIVYLKDPKSLASEAYRTIRTALLLSQAGEPPRTILVSSAQSSEGKTTSSVNLAACLASAGGQVVLVDADLRRPSVFRHFGIDPDSPGLVEVLTGQRTLEEVEIKDAALRITVLPSGKIPPNPAELLGSLEMASILDRLASRFDYVLIDSPPVLPVADSVILSRYVDGVVLVVKGGSTPKKVVYDAKARLQSVGARLLGAILNEVDITSGDYYYYNRYYYSYYQSDRGRPQAKAAAAR